MDWIALTETVQLADIKELSKNKPQLIFKHSTRCSISGVAKNRLEKSIPPQDIDFYFLDLIKNRDILINLVLSLM